MILSDAKLRELSDSLTRPPEAAEIDVMVRVEMSEFADWMPERIAAFFDGIATVLSAQKNGGAR